MYQQQLLPAKMQDNNIHFALSQARPRLSDPGGARAGYADGQVALVDASGNGA